MSQSEEKKEEIGTAAYQTLDSVDLPEEDYIALALDIDARRRVLDSSNQRALAELSAKAARISIQIIPEDDYTNELINVLRDSSAVALCFMQAQELVFVIHKEVERLKAIVGEAPTNLEADNVTKH